MAYNNTGIHFDLWRRYDDTSGVIHDKRHTRQQPDKHLPRLWRQQWRHQWLTHQEFAVSTEAVSWRHGSCDRWACFCTVYGDYDFLCACHCINVARSLSYNDSNQVIPLMHVIISLHLFSYFFHSRSPSCLFFITHKFLVFLFFYFSFPFLF